MYRTHTNGELRIENANQEVTLCGWVQRAKDLGGMAFIDLRDRYGITQLAFNNDTNIDLCEQAKKLGVFVHYGQISIWGVIMFLAIFVVLFTLFVITSTSTNDEVAKHRLRNTNWNNNL